MGRWGFNVLTDQMPVRGTVHTYRVVDGLVDKRKRNMQKSGAYLYGYAWRAYRNMSAIWIFQANLLSALQSVLVVADISRTCVFRL